MIMLWFCANQASASCIQANDVLVDSNQQSAMLMGVYAQFMKLYMAWLQAVRDLGVPGSD